MKKNLILAAAFICTVVLGFTACSDDDEDLLASQVPTVVQNSFETLFAGNTALWEKEHGRYKAEFWQDGREVEVWFNSDGSWVRTERDLIPADLPEAVTAYVRTNYPDYHIDDADYVETPSGSYYDLELEKAGSRDIRLKLTADGRVL